MGATGMGKSRLSADIATYFQGEITNSDKMQVYKGLEIVTNKITHAEKQGVRHYFLGEIEPNSEFTAEDLCLESILYIEFFLKTQCVPIIVGGSISYIEKLVEKPMFMFKYKYDSCFIWIDVEQSVLNRRVDTRVDEMVNAAKTNTFINNNNNKFNKKKVEFIRGATGMGKSFLSTDIATHFRGEIIYSDKMKVYKGLEIVTNKITHAKKQGVRHYLLGLVDEVQQIFILDAYYTKGIRRCIGVPEMARYLTEEKNIDGDDESKKMILQASISIIKCNTRILICN
uniref:Isopentenyltransferase n=1 Tax=Solanum tuberosum TaxID=4113 RepID=M1DHY3_SOLTU